MPHYAYRARNAQGQVVKGEVEASSEDKAVAVLHSNNLIPVEIKEVEKTSVWHMSVLGGDVNAKDLILFCRQMASMVKSGVQILEALRALADQTKKEKYKNLLQKMAFDIEGGVSLSVAMSRHRDVFSPFILGVVRVGEASGQLSPSMDSIADYLEQDYIFMRKVYATLTYPAIVLIVTAFLVGIMFTFVLPQLVSLFEEADVLLPLSTRILISITKVVQSYWWMILIILGAFGWIFRSYMKTPEGAYNLSTYVLSIPILSTLFQKIYLSRLTAVMSTLFKSDLPVIESLELSRETVGSRVYARIIDDTVDAVKDGASISAVWKHEPFILPMLTAMVGVGERSGNLSQAFDEANAFFRRDIASSLDTISTLLEPILIIVLCIGVGIVVSGILLPIYNLVLVL